MLHPSVEVISLTEIADLELDYVLISVLREGVAEEMKEELLKRGCLKTKYYSENL